MTDTTIENGTVHDVASDTAVGAVDRAAVDERSQDYGAQAADKARAFVGMGKDRATDALAQLSRLLTDAAGQVDEKLGAQYGDYAREAAGQVTAFADRLKAKDADALVDDARGYIRRSPGMAIGIAATLGFVAARLVQSGIDAGGGTDEA